MKTAISTIGQIVLPEEIRRHYGIEAGEEFEIERIDRGEYRLVRVSLPRNQGLLEWLLACPSGGEKAVALHLPLFAAAAAHYGSAHTTAPRIILLEEAFAGIDLRMRGRCMGLLVDFDLDFMMTSHEEWGCHEELPSVATYQLYRDPALEGVAAVRFVWSGNRLREHPD